MNQDKIQKNIEEHGWHFIFVFDPEGERTDFAYSIGFEESYDHPEIMIFGLKRDTAHGILTDIAHELKNGHRFELGEKLGGLIGGDYEVMLRAVKESVFSEYLGTAVNFYKKPFRAWVLFWPDKSNTLPTEENCKLTVQNEALEII